MHRLAATPGGWNSDVEGVVFIEQTPAPIVFLSAADTDISALNQAIEQLPDSFSDIRAVNLLQLQQQLTIDTYAEDVLRYAQLIIVRLLGGRAYWSYGLEVVKETVEKTGATLVVLPGEERPDLDAMSHSTLSLSMVNRLWQYFVEGGVENIRNALLYISNVALSTNYSIEEPQSVPKLGIYPWLRSSSVDIPIKEGISGPTACVAVLFYRAHYLSGNTRIIDATCEALLRVGLSPVPIYVSSLKAVDTQQALIQMCRSDISRNTAFSESLTQGPIELIVNTTSFAIASVNQTGVGASLWQQLDVPVLQAICSGSPRTQWQTHPQGLTPRDIAMNVALPEVDGRIITRAVSFKASATPGLKGAWGVGSGEWGSREVGERSLQTDVVVYEPEADRVEFVARLAENWVRLGHSLASERRVALVLANYPNRDGRMANGVGLDTPQSCLTVLRALKQAGYTVSELPETGDALMALLAAGTTNDPEGYGLRPVLQRLSLSEYLEFFETLPEAVRKGVIQRWGNPAEEWRRAGRLEEVGSSNCLPIAGVQFGNVFVGIQPSRGYDLDPSLNYHAPDLEPTHAYLGFYAWVRSHFQAQAIVHVGKHGNLEWLPGKGIALSERCYPEAAFGPMPHFYPFIVNDPGEGAQAKRRSQAVILDHLTPPMTRAELYGPLQQLESLVDEYYEAQNLDPIRLKVIGPKIVALLRDENLRQDLSLSMGEDSTDLQTWLPQIDGYLCELKEAQIRDGLHVFGVCPNGEQLRDLVVAIARHPTRWHGGLTRAIAEYWGIDIDPLTDDPALLWTEQNEHTVGCRTVGTVIERLELFAMRVVDDLIEAVRNDWLGSEQARCLPYRDSPLSSVIDWMADCLLPNLERTSDELDNLLHGLEGGYVNSGPSGAPTRNRPEVLPTGRNFYSVDIRAIPTESAWDVGRKAAELVVENYAQEEGEYPRTLGLSMWGTAAMRTGGDDIAEALALLGVRPVWDGPSRRVIDFEILPLSVLGRPRVDVTLRVSGFFRDAFPNLISLFDQAVMAVAALDEPEAQNPLAAQVKRDETFWQEQGLDEEKGERRSRYRVFGSKPGAYGAGLQGLIEAQNWESDADLARAYINWSSYAYGVDRGSGEGGQADGQSIQGSSAPEAFGQRLAQMQIVLQNQDNREHDLLDSDDYYQFQGGLTAAVKTKRGSAPVTYFGDNAVPEKPRVRSLASEIARVYRSRVVNPKWIKGVMRHGYKGAFELSATVDYLFAYDATTGCAEDHMYKGVAEAYVFDPAVRAFVEKSNPWALRDMAERLLEAQQRGLWQEVSDEMVDGLRAIAHEAEGKIESGLSNLS